MGEENFKQRLQERSSRHKILRGFSRKKVNYDDVVKHYYIEDGLAYISCNVRSFHEVIDRHSVPGYEWPNAEFLRFVDGNANYIPSEYPIVLEICGTTFSQKQQEIITRTLGRYYELRFADAQLTVNNKWFKANCLLVMAILSAIIWVIYVVFMENSSMLVEEIMVIVFWFFLWEWGDVFALEIRHEKTVRTESAQLASMKIIFSDRFVDIPLDEDTKEEIIEEILSE